MAVATMKCWPTTEKTPLPELFGISEDLMSAWLLFRNAETVAASISTPLNQYEILDALISSAIIKYLRSFGTGARLKLNISEIGNLTDDLLNLHDHLKAFRDRHIAHPVSAFETEAVYVSVHEDGTERAEIKGVSSGQRSSQMLDSRAISRSVALCEIVMEHVRRKMAEESARLLNIAKALTADEINALPLGPIEPNPDPKSRRK